MQNDIQKAWKAEVARFAWLAQKQARACDPSYLCHLEQLADVFEAKVNARSAPDTGLVATDAGTSLRIFPQPAAPALSAQAAAAPPSNGPDFFSLDWETLFA